MLCTCKCRDSLPAEENGVEGDDIFKVDSCSPIPARQRTPDVDEPWKALKRDLFATWDKYLSDGNSSKGLVPPVRGFQFAQLAPREPVFQFATNRSSTSENGDAAAQPSAPASPLFEVAEDAADQPLKSARRRLQRRPSMDLLTSLTARPSMTLQVMIENKKDINYLYDIGSDILGKGSYGIVRKGNLKSTGASRAIKSVSKGYESSSQEKACKEEVEIMKQIDHPNVVKLYELFEDTENLFMVLELCMGWTLYSRIRGIGKLNDADASKLMIQLFRAIYYLHRNNICHRDIKPENCLFVTPRWLEANNLRVSDFGLSRVFSHGEVLTQRAGTLNFMAPEVIDKKYTFTCDAWSCAVTMYYMLSGHLPFHGKDDDELRANVRLGKFDFPASEWAHVAGEGMDLLRKLLVVNPAKRWTCDKAMKHEWIKKYDMFELDVDWQDLIGRLLRFRTLNRLKRTALHIIASLVDEETLVASRRAFVALDANGDGLVSVDEIKKCLRRECKCEDLRKSITGNLLRIKVSSASSSGKEFTYTEFLAATLDKRHANRRDMCWAAFCALDGNSDGSISISELAEFNILGQLSGEDLQELVAAFDNNNDGEIDFEEFVQMMFEGEGDESPKATGSMPMHRSSTSDTMRSTATTPSAARSQQSQPSSSSSPRHAFGSEGRQSKDLRDLDGVSGSSPSQLSPSGQGSSPRNPRRGMTRLLTWGRRKSQ